MNELPTAINIKIENMNNYKLVTVTTVEKLLEILEKYKDAHVCELELYHPFFKL